MNVYTKFLDRARNYDVQDYRARAMRIKLAKLLFKLDNGLKSGRPQPTSTDESAK